MSQILTIIIIAFFALGPIIIICCAITSAKKVKSSGEIARSIIEYAIKLILIACLFVFLLVNYRYLSFNKGWSTTSINDYEDSKAIFYIDEIPTKVEYYKLVIPNEEYEYKIFIETDKSTYLFKATEDDLDALDFASIFAKDIKPKLITPVPFYVEILLSIIISLIPFGIAKKSNKSAEDKKTD